MATESDVADLNERLSQKAAELGIETEEDDDPCWEGYEMVGFQDNGDPRCVPVDEAAAVDVEADEATDDMFSEVLTPAESKAAATSADAVDHKELIVPYADEVIVDLVYGAERAAEKAAEQMGMEATAHGHELDGRTVFMPGPDHDTYVNAYNELAEEPIESEGEELDECVESVLEDNPGYSESRAYAICNSQMEAKAGFDEGEVVRWSWNGEPVYGRVSEKRPEQATVDGNTITGDEGEPVYLIDEYDERVDGLRSKNVAKPESSLNSSPKDIPERDDANYVDSSAWDDLTTTVSESDFTAVELDFISHDMGDVLQKSAPNEWLVPDPQNPVVYRADIPDKYLDGRDESFFVPNAGVAENARKVKDWRDEHGDDVAGGASDGEGTRRATQLIEHADRGEPLPIEYWRETRAFHERHRAQNNHELDADAEGEPWTDSGYVSDLNWGGDEGFEQAQRVMDVVEEVEQEAAVTLEGAVATSQSLSPSTLTKQGTNEVDVDALDGELAEAVEADDFYIYGKASIEQWDADDPPTYIKMDALEDALDRYFGSTTAPGIISRHHQDIPVGTPVREFEFETDTTLEIDGEAYDFEAGDTARSHVEDADGDGKPELWLAANIDKETQMGMKTRVLAAQGDLNGFSVTVHRNRDELTQEGRYVTDCDLHAVTIGTDEQIKNKGSEFDVASFKGRVKQTFAGLLR